MNGHHMPYIITGLVFFFFKHNDVALESHFSELKLYMLYIVAKPLVYMYLVACFVL